MGLLSLHTLLNFDGLRRLRSGSRQGAEPALARVAELSIRVFQEFFRVAGTSFRQDAIASVAVGDPARLEPEPDNPHDEDAIKVMVIKPTGGMHVGYVPFYLCRRVLKFIAQDKIEAACVSGVGKPVGSPNVGLAIEMTVKGEASSQEPMI